jgi:hypothetical protein
MVLVFIFRIVPAIIETVNNLWMNLKPADGFNIRRPVVKPDAVDVNNQQR